MAEPSAVTIYAPAAGSSNTLMPPLYAFESTVMPERLYTPAFSASTHIVRPFTFTAVSLTPTELTPDESVPVRNSVKPGVIAAIRQIVAWSAPSTSVYLKFFVSCGKFRRQSLHAVYGHSSISCAVEYPHRGLADSVYQRVGVGVLFAITRNWNYTGEKITSLFNMAHMAAAPFEEPTAYIFSWSTPFSVASFFVSS